MSETNGFSGQYGNAKISSTAIAEVKAWEFEPAQKLGAVVTNATGGFESQVYGAISGKGSVTVVIPRAASTGAMKFGTSATLNLFCDAASAHGFENIKAVLESSPVSVELASENAVEIKYNFKSSGPFTGKGACDVIGSGGSSSGA